MAATLIYRKRTSDVPSAESVGEALWLSHDDLQRASGWELKPEGVCQGELCVPIPAARTSEFVRDGSVNLAAIAALLDEPVVHDAAGSVWVFGESAGARRESLASLEAPDFTLPDLEGSLHSLSEQRGKKVLLVSWASW